MGRCKAQHKSYMKTALIYDHACYGSVHARIKISKVDVINHVSLREKVARNWNSTEVVGIKLA